MQIIVKTVPAGTKIYATLANCCRHQRRRPCGVQAVLDATTKNAIGFAALPEKETPHRHFVWVK